MCDYCREDQNRTLALFEKKTKKNNIERVVKLVILSSNITCKIDREYVNLFYCV